MKKLTYVLFALAALLILAVPANAAQAGSDPPSAESFAPAMEENVPETNTETASPADGSGDAPVDESTYREEPSAPHEPTQRFPGRGKIDDILSYWEENGYPPCVSYAFEAGGEVMEDGTVCAWWEIGLVDEDEARKEAILKLVSPNCLVEFRHCLFTHAQKQTAYDTITELAVNDPNILEVVFIRNDDTVWVAVPDELTKEYARYLIRDLGLGAVVSVTDPQSIGTVADLESGIINSVTTPGLGVDTSGIAVPGGETGLVPAAPAVSQPSPVFWVCLALAIVAACTLTALALRRHFAPAAVTENGTIRTGSAPLTRAQAEQAVRDGMEAPPAALFWAIVERKQDGPKE